MTAAAHKVLLENPEMYRNITNVQALRKEQARRWAQRIVGLNDPGPGSVEQAFMYSGEMSDLIPKLLDQKSKLLKPLAEKATEALKQRTGLDDSLSKILIANIGAEGQTKASWLSASGGLSQDALELSLKGLEQQGQYARDALGFATPKDEVSVAKITAAYASATARTASGGDSSQTEAEDLLRTMPPGEVAGVMLKALESEDSGVVDQVESLIERAGQQGPMVNFMATKAFEDEGMKAKFNAFGLGVTVSGEEGTSQVDRMQQALSRGMVATHPGRGATLRKTLEAMGDPKLKQQLDDAIEQKTTPEEKKALKDVDDALAKANKEVDLTSPTEMREQIRTSSGYVEEAERALEQAGIEDDGRLMGLGAAARRAARQQSRGLEKSLEGAGEDATVSTRRLALSKAQSLARKNKAPGWANSEDDKVAEGAEAARAKSTEPAEGKKKDPTSGSFDLDDFDDSDIKTDVIDNKEGMGTFKGEEIDGWKITPSAREKVDEASKASIDAARASRRSGAAGALKGMMEGFRNKPVPEIPEEDDEEKLADAGPAKRPADYWRTRRA
jgi:hypothetical protein